MRFATHPFVKTPFLFTISVLFGSTVFPCFGQGQPPVCPSAECANTTFVYQDLDGADRNVLVYKPTNCPTQGCPLYLWIDGTNQDTQLNNDKYFLREMVARGFAAASVEYNDATLDYVRGCNGFEEKSEAIFSGPNSAVGKMCGELGIANCDLGIAVHGWSQGSHICALSGKYNRLVSAALLFGGGALSCLTDDDQFKVLSKQRRRSITGENDNFFGGNYNGVLAQQKDLTGQDCATTRSCFSRLPDTCSYGSGGDQQCNDDGRWYDLNCAECNLVSSCQSNSGISSRACPLNPQVPDPYVLPPSCPAGTFGEERCGSSGQVYNCNCNECNLSVSCAENPALSNCACPMRTIADGSGYYLVPPPNDQHGFFNAGADSTSGNLNSAFLDPTVIWGLTKNFDWLAQVAQDVYPDLTSRFQAASDELSNSPAGEGPEKAFDGDFQNTKWLADVQFQSSVWLKVQLTNSVVIKSYSITSADDEPGRDPQDWILEGSNDDNTWFELDRRLNEDFPDRSQTRMFFNTTIDVKYRYYRLDVTNNNGGSETQIAEVRLYGFDDPDVNPVPAPSPPPPPPSPPPPPPPCFSLRSFTNVKGKGKTPITELRLEDYVQSDSSGKFSKVYAFGDRDMSRPALFTSIVTQSSELELTPDHMVYLANQSIPVPASSIRVNDVLQGIKGEEEIVVRVGQIRRNGFITPLTTNGKIVIDGIVASCYAGKKGSGHYLGKGGLVSNMLHYHVISHIALAPLRFMCTKVSSFLCSEEFHHDIDSIDHAGKHMYVASVHSLKHFVKSGECGFALHLLLFCIVVGLGLIFYALESPFCVMGVFGLVARAFLAKNRKETKLVVAPKQKKF